MYKILKNNIFAILCTILVAITAGIIPALSAISMESLINHKSEFSYIITYSIVLIQTFIHRIQEFQLQQLKAKIYPMAIIEFSKQAKLNIENITNIAYFLSNFWPICFFVKSISLILSMCLINFWQQTQGLTSWFSLMLFILLLSIYWQPKTEKISQEKQIVQNKLIQEITNKNNKTKYLAHKNMLKSIKINQIIFTQEIYKTIVVASILLAIMLNNWHLFIQNKITISQTIMLSSITFNVAEVIWWLQHELALWRVQLVRFLTALKQTQL